ncbi:MAG: nucleotidyltransferase domain-containing protein [Bacillota bacterium]
MCGSVPAGWRHEESDIDLAVEGDMPFEDLRRLWCELDRWVEREVDVRLLAELPFAKKVCARGIVVYERAPASGAGPGLAGQNVR